MAGPARFLALLALLLGLASLGLHLLLPPQPEAQAASPSPAAAAPAAGDPAGFRRSAAAAAAGPVFEPAALHAFPDPNVEVRARATATFPALFPPQQFRATAQEGGVRLTWQPHPENPVTGRHFKLVRWTGDGEARVIAETSGLEYFDPVECEGVSYHYRLHAVLRREILDSTEAERESPAAAAEAELPRTMKWEAVGLEPGGERIRLLARRPGRDPRGPFTAGPDEELGPTGWYLEDFRVRETEVPIQTRAPRFDALGRRVIIDGRPADRVREATAKRLLALVRLSDPCGSFWSFELLLPEEVAEDER